MEIASKREKTRNYAVKYIWAILVAILLLFDRVFSMGACLGRFKESEAVGIESNISHGVESISIVHLNKIDKKDIKKDPNGTIQEVDEMRKEKKEIAEILLDYLHIQKHTDMYTASKNSIPIMHDICKRMEYRKENNRYYIDLIDFYITRNNPKSKFHNYERFEKALKRIGGIRFDFVYINSYLPLAFAKMLIRRIVVEHDLNINCSQWSIVSTGQSNSNPTRCTAHDIFSKTQWEEPTTFQLSLNRCSEGTIQDILKSVTTRAIRKIVISSSFIEKLDLEGVEIINGCSITLLELTSIKRIVSLEAKEKQSISSDASTTNTSSAPNAVKSSLYLDRISLKSLANSYKETENAEERKVLRVKNLHLEYAPYTFQEIADMGCSSWIQIKNLIIHADICDECHIYKEDLIVEKSLPDVVKKMGVQHTTTTSACRIVNNNLESWNNRDTAFHRFLQAISDESAPAMSYKYCLNGHPKYFMNSFQIDLKDSTKIQEAIAMFRESYDMMSAYTMYKSIAICGSGNAFNDLELLASIIKCMGPRIQVESIFFHNIKEWSGLGSQKEDHMSIGMPKTKFIVKGLYFNQSEEGFIKSMLTRHTHPLQAKIYVNNKISTKKYQEDLMEAAK
ncbi:hypothetical protein NEFER01_2169 [Nematocida sp. LUAm1]|nr:hypothetical protein NEFER02_2204 [Nematocida sp. LUAm2]KAI5179325.1 hypothetical protein NEFER01_2169 [Nematocida sp. LUAm1]